MPDKEFYRLGWAIFEEGSDVSSIASTIEGRTINDEKVYCVPQKSFALQIKVADLGLGGGEGRIASLLEAARKLVSALDGRSGLDSWLFPLIGEKDKIYQLDLAIVYLRQVHFCCLMTGAIFAGPLDLSRAAGDLYLRTATSASPEPVEPDAAVEGPLEESLQDLLDRIAFQCDPITEDAYRPQGWLIKCSHPCRMLERQVAKVDEGRYRCIHCSKLFKGPEFVIKHIRLKHEEISSAAILDTAMINNFFARPCPSLLLPAPPRRRRTVAPPPFPAGGGRYERSRDRPMSGRRHAPPPPPRDAPQDPRRMRQYVDWDAPAMGDIEISYD